MINVLYIIGNQESQRTEKHFGSKKHYKGEMITHIQGEVLLVYFFSVLNKKSHPYIEYISDLYEKFRSEGQRFRVVGVNYDPKDIYAYDVIQRIPGYKSFYFYSIDSGALNNGHLEKYGLTILPKMLLVDK